MFKKVVSLVVLMALVMSAAAFAAVNSPAWPTGPVAVSASSGTVTALPLTEAAKAIVDAIKDKTAADIFGDEAKLQAISSGAVPSDIDFAAYKLDRVFSLTITDADTTQDLTVDFPVVPAYAADAKLLGAVGIIENGAASWTAVKASVVESAVESVIPAATVDAVQNGSGEAVYAILVG
ncbi:MAG: hypothetical protein E7317_07060 [Clostridiales bacterium]|nr:hypothetical protein [Clostridiales bacterium]